MCICLLEIEINSGKIVNSDISISDYINKERKISSPVNQCSITDIEVSHCNHDIIAKGSHITPFKLLIHRSNIDNLSDRSSHKTSTGCIPEQKLEYIAWPLCHLQGIFSPMYPTNVYITMDLTL